MSRITQKGANGPLAIVANGAFQSSTDANLATLVGTRWDLADGREVILVGTSSTTTATAGQLYQDAAIVPNHQSLATVTYTAYSNNGNTPPSIVVTLAGTASTANQYQGGFAIVAAGTGLGQTLHIAGNTAATSTSNATITLADGPAVALDTTSSICLLPPHGANVIQNPTTPTGAVVGVALYPIAASSYGFLVSKGVTGALSDATVPSVGNAISPSVTTAGAITLAHGSTAAVAQIGYANQTAVSAQSRSVFLNV